MTRAARPEDLATALRVLAMDSVQHAGSGHPGMPMGMADIAVALWHRHLRHNPADPGWPDRDRFVLSNGHGSTLLYNLLHLTGYDLGIEDLRKARQFGSRTPGHPEYRITPGVETTTGPLGQGLANAVGMALAERLLAASFNRPGHAIVDHFTYVFAGDGCLMEGISHEVSSLAGALGLGKLILLYDDNGVSIDGDVTGWFADDTPRRFEAYGWQVMANVDGHDIDAVDAAIAAAKADLTRPSIICCKTVIGKGAATMAGHKDCHGAPLGEAEVARTRTALDWPHPPFVVPEAIARAWNATVAGAAAQAEWQRRFDLYRAVFPLEAAAFERRMKGELPGDFAALAQGIVDSAVSKAQGVAGRKASQDCIAALAAGLPDLVGGSADLSTSNLTVWNAARTISRDGDGNYISYGVREFGMAAMMNGMLSHGGLRPFAGTYLVFSDYSRNALRMAALMGLGAIHVLTHDSIAVGGDGPTHQPAEHLASLRLIPNLDVWRPCDSVETAVAWTVALERRSGPTVLALSRQTMNFKTRSQEQIRDIRRGGYVLRREEGPLAAVLIATGAEVDLALVACERLAKQGLQVRVVSMPSTLCFDRQDLAWRRAVLPPGVPRIAIEAGVTDYWRKYVGLDGICIGVDDFGHSAPPETLFAHFGVTADSIVAAVQRLQQDSRS
ncbi:MAG: transketolase [Hyphomicrobiales bacterium]